MAIDKRLRVAKIILEVLEEKGVMRWSILEKEVTRRSPTYAYFRSTLRWLLKRGYVKRVRRGLYAITSEGRGFLDVI